MTHDKSERPAASSHHPRSMEPVPAMDQQTSAFRFRFARDASVRSARSARSVARGSATTGLRGVAWNGAPPRHAATSQPTQTCASSRVVG